MILQPSLLRSCMKSGAAGEVLRAQDFTATDVTPLSHYLLVPEGYDRIYFGRAARRDVCCH